MRTGSRTSFVGSSPIPFVVCPGGIYSDICTCGAHQDSGEQYRGDGVLSVYIISLCVILPEPPGWLPQESGLSGFLCLSVCDESER